ncbi:hypothetical protein ACFWPV_25610 [Streptomyces uncialis]|uniref:hypothetical protein n=1 Tax=Streptomyces uncialis TaxID=1048205 RepID=UPI00365BBA30
MTPSAPIPDNSVIITPTEAYAEVRATHDEVKIVSAELDALPGDLADHESRIRTLEAARWSLPSIAAVAAAAGLGLYRFLSR